MNPNRQQIFRVVISSSGIIPTTNDLILAPTALKAIEIALRAVIKRRSYKSTGDCTYSVTVKRVKPSTPQSSGAIEMGHETEVFKLEHNQLARPRKGELGRRVCDLLDKAVGKR